MTEEKSKKIIELAPWMFKLIESENPIYPICFGFENDDGWYNILYNLVSDISKLDKNKEIRVLQIKEKFGGLRFYISSCPNNIFDEVYKKIEQAEFLSEKTCEICGKEGKIRGEGWLKALCDDCNEKEDR